MTIDGHRGRAGEVRVGPGRAGEFPGIPTDLVPWLIVASRFARYNHRLHRAARIGRWNGTWGGENGGRSKKSTNGLGRHDEKIPHKEEKKKGEEEIKRNRRKLSDLSKKKKKKASLLALNNFS